MGYGGSYPLSVLEQYDAFLSNLSGCCIMALGTEETMRAVRIHRGAGEKNESEKYAGNGIVLMALFGIFLFLVTTIFLTPMLKFFGATNDVLPYAKAYTRITAFGFPFLIANTGMSKLILADGSPRYSMISMLAGAIVNTILDPLFIFVFNMGMTGAALATITGQIISFSISLRYMFHFKTIKLSRESFIVSAAHCKKIFILFKGICNPR